MDTKLNLSAFPQNIVYVRPVTVSDLPKEMQAQAAGFETVYAVHNSDGAPLALVPNRRQAFALARENDLTPVNVH